MMFARATVRVLGLGSTVVLARLLAPADYGVIAAATAVAGALELLTLFSFESALIQQKHIAADHYDSAWTLNVILGLTLGLALIAVARPAAHFYREPRVAPVLMILAVKYVLDNAGNPGTVDFRRRLQFRTDFIMQVGPKLASLPLTLVLAFWLRDYRALLCGMVASSIASCAISYAVHPHRPRVCFAQARTLFSFSRWLLLTNLVYFCRHRSADLIIGSTLGAASLGTFSIACEISNLPSTEMVAPINRVLYPGYAQIAGDAERLRAAFCATLGMIALAILPVCLLIAAVSDPLVRLLLGQKWAAAAAPISILALAGACAVLHSNTGSVYAALGKPKIAALNGVANVALLLPALWVGVHFDGVAGVSAAVLALGVLGLFSTYFVFVRQTPIQVADIATVCWRPIVAGAISYACVRAMLASITFPEGLLGSSLAVAAGLFLGATIDIAAVAVLWVTAGRPAGAESAALQQAAALAKRFTVRRALAGA